MMTLVRCEVFDLLDACTLPSPQVQGRFVPCDQQLPCRPQVDEDGSGEIEFSEFIRVIEKQKADAMSSQYDSDTLEAFVALGGNVRAASAMLCPVLAPC